jgi:phage-related protein (TIGR01555 family)
MGGQLMQRIRITDNARAGMIRMQQADGMENFLTGMGLQGDKTVGTQWIARELDRNQLNAAYRGDWVARKVVAIPSEDATREWRSWQADPNDITLIEELERVFKVKQKTKQADQKGRLYGGGAMVLGVDSGLPEEPLVYDNVKKGDLKFIHVVSRWDLTVTELERDLMSPFYGKPKFYQSTTGAAGGIMRIHPSRVIPFIGSEHPDPMNNPSPGWGDPVLQAIADAVKACSTVSQSVAGLISELQTDIVRIPGMVNQLKTADYERRLLKRFGLAATAKSIYKILLLDKDEEWQRINANLSGVHELIKVYLLIASGAADIPATRMVGQAPQGLNATGDGDLRNYYDRVATEQKTTMQPNLEPLDEVLIRSALGARPEEIFYNWNPLWQPTPEQSAELASKKATTFTADVNSGVIEPAIMREARIAQLIEDGTYPGLEQIIEDLDLNGEFLEADPMDPDDDPTDEDGPDEAVEGEGGDKGDSTLKDAKRRKRVRIGAEVRARYRPRDVRGVSGAGRFAPDRTPRAMPAEVRRFMFGDATTPRSLYVYRPVLNANEIRKHFKAQGLEAMVPAKEMHVTIMYSKSVVDWSKVGESYPGGNDDGRIQIRPGGMRLVERFKDALVLVFNSTDLQWRHQDIKHTTECEWEWPDYTPHITLTYDSNKLPRGTTFEPYRGKIILGPEVWEEATEGWGETLIEDA